MCRRDTGASDSGERPFMKTSEYRFMLGTLPCHFEVASSKSPWPASYRADDAKQAWVEAVSWRLGARCSGGKDIIDVKVRNSRPRPTVAPMTALALSGCVSVHPIPPHNPHLDDDSTHSSYGPSSLQARSLGPSILIGLDDSGF